MVMDGKKFCKRNPYSTNYEKKSKFADSGLADNRINTFEKVEIMTQFFDTWLNKPKKELEIANFVAGILLVCAMPFTSHRLPIFLNIWLGTWLLEGNFKAKFKANYSVQNRNLLILGVLFYFSYVFGLLFTPDVKLGLVDIVQKLSLLIAPIVLLGANDRYYNKTHWILLSFAGANLVAEGVCLFHVFGKISKMPGYTFSMSFLRHLEHLDYCYLSYSYLIHPSYFALFILLSILCVYYSFQKRSFFVQSLFISGLLLGVFLCDSRANIISLFIVFFFWLISVIMKSKYKYFFFLLYLLFALVSLKLILDLSRFDYVKSAVSSYNTESFKERVHQANVRTDIWIASIAVIRGNVVSGVGTGNEKRMISKTFTEQNKERYASLNYDSHNQFLQNMIGQGLCGLLPLVLLFIFGFCISLRPANKISIYFIVILAVNFMFESFLQTISGIVLFSFFFYLLNFSICSPNSDDSSFH